MPYVTVFLRTECEFYASITKGETFHTGPSGNDWLIGGGDWFGEEFFDHGFHGLAGIREDLGFVFLVFKASVLSV
jgi:hypothetical protein